MITKVLRLAMLACILMNIELADARGRSSGGSRSSRSSSASRSSGYSRCSTTTTRRTTTTPEPVDDFDDFFDSENDLFVASSTISSVVFKGSPTPGGWASSPAPNFDGSGVQVQKIWC